MRTTSVYNSTMSRLYLAHLADSEGWSVAQTMYSCGPHWHLSTIMSIVPYTGKRPVKEGLRKD